MRHIRPMAPGLDQTIRQAADCGLLLVFGADRDEHVRVEGGRVVVDGASDLFRLLDPNDRFHRLHVTRSLLRNSRRPELEGYGCIVNLITEAEHNPRVLETLRKLVRGLGARVINRPEAVLRSTRDQVARRLEGIAGLWVPGAVRLRSSKPDLALRSIERSGLRFPLILRQAGTHTGRIVGLVRDPGELEAGLGAGGEMIATEFVDFAGSDGLYRKYRVFMIGRHRIARHMLVSDGWNVHAKDRRRFMAGRAELIAEEEAVLAEPGGVFPGPVAAALEAVRERMELDFFGLDFGITACGEAVLFEANATMNFFPFLNDPAFAYLRGCIAPARDAFRELLGLEAGPSPAARAEPAVQAR